MFTSIEDAIEWIVTDKSRFRNLDEFRQILHETGDPQDDFYTIHVTGTNGKGSTINYLCDLLMSQGFKVGTFTSPHYVTHLDRIRVNGNNIPEDRFLEILNHDYDMFVREKLSTLQMDFMIMCEHFKREKVDIAIVEVGIGGRLDYTNVFHNTKLSIIASVGYDHMEKLGNTLEEICKDKCGIIKEDSAVLCGHLPDTCKDIVKEDAEEKNAKVYMLGEYKDLGDRHFLYDKEEYEISSYASYQLHNASLAIEAFHIVMKDKGLSIDEDAAKEALKKSLWHCRFEIVKEEPRVILDGAHNIHGVEALAESFDQFEGTKCIVFSALKRKEYRKMIDVLRRHCDRLIITDFPKSGVIDLKEFSDLLTIRDYKKAIGLAMETYDNVLICGSLYFMSEVVLNCRFD